MSSSFLIEKKPFPFEDFDEEQLSPEMFLEALFKISKKWPNEFDQDLFKLYQQYIAFSEQEFRNHRSLKHQLRIIISFYLMRKKLLLNRFISNDPDLNLRILPTNLHFPFGEKPVLGLVVAIQLSSSYERLDDSHILLAFQKLLPQTHAVKESFLTFKKPTGLLHLLYLEVEKTTPASFSKEELDIVNKSLKKELKRHVETLIPTVFGIHGVEETIRNIVSLSQELQSPSDIPQVMISLERTLETALVFRIIIIRALKKTSLSLIEHFQNLEKSVSFMHERSSIIGHFSNSETVKEASVLRLQIPKQPFLLRSDSSFNFYQARHYALYLLTQALGEVRDYNGGIFSKQLELLSQFKSQFPQIAKSASELLEDFFYSLQPPEMQVIIPLSSLAKLFSLLLKEKPPSGKTPFLKFHREDDHVFSIIHYQDPSFHKHVENSLKEKQCLRDLITWVNFENHGSSALGYIYHAPSKQHQSQFCQILYEAKKSWIEKTQNFQMLRLSSQQLPVSLDPRLGGDEISSVILKMLFEGLTRIGKDGKPHLALAKEVILSKDQKTYTFKLRECFWSNGDSITAHDFCYTWKKLLSPNFTSAFAHLFYVILNAKKAKQGIVPISEIGIDATDDLTLTVHLENTCFDFLELTAHPFYFPVNHRIDALHPNWPLKIGSAYICNGPFLLEHSGCREIIKLKKNQYYWDRDNVQLEQIQITRANGREALEMFKKKEIDWLGHPLRIWEPAFLHQGNQIEQIPFSTSYWYVFNVQQFPFQSLKIREAFALAIDRQAIIDHLSYPATPAFTPLPPNHTQFPHLTVKKYQDVKKLFEQALHEMGLSKEDFPPIILIHTSNELRKHIAQIIAQQWRDVLGITVKTESYSFKSLFKKMTKGEYQIGVMSWWPKVDDPLYTLNIFKESEELINFSKWKNNSYAHLLEKASKEMRSKKRDYLLAKAEAILIKEKPVIPIFHEMKLFSKQKYVDGIFLSKLGNVDFKYASINKEIKYANPTKSRRPLWSNTYHD